MSRLKKHVRNYTQVANDIINDDRLSLKAKGLYLFLVSKPDNWTFSARLIATQNNDQKASINSALQELERFGLLKRVHVQCGYDYEIFDEIKIHSTENRLNGKSVKRLPKIDSIENRSNISNKESQVREEERENKIYSETEFPFLAMWLSDLCSARSVKNKSAYRSFIKTALLNTSHDKHAQTMSAYVDYSNEFSLSRVKSLPDGISAFDLYENSAV